MTNTAYLMFLFGFLASAGIFYNVGKIRASSRYASDITRLTMEVARLKLVNRMTGEKK